MNITKSFGQYSIIRFTILGIDDCKISPDLPETKGSVGVHMLFWDISCEDLSKNYLERLFQSSRLQVLLESHHMFICHELLVLLGD